MPRTVLIVLLSIAGAWFLFIEAIALLMSTGLADEPGDTNGFRRFVWYSMYSLPAVPVIILCSVSLYRNRRRNQHGFPVIQIPDGDRSESQD